MHICYEEVQMALRKTLANALSKLTVYQLEQVLLKSGANKIVKKKSDMCDQVANALIGGVVDFQKDILSVARLDQIVSLSESLDIYCAGQRKQTVKNLTEWFEKEYTNVFANKQVKIPRKDTDENQYCSWCFRKTRHMLIDHNIIQRNIYRCIKCGNFTVQCRYCKNMAKSKPAVVIEDDSFFNYIKSTWNDELCAEHDGKVASFNKLSMRLDDITLWADVYKYKEKLNLSKGAKIAGCMLAGTAVFLPLSLLALPGFASALGSLGLLGAASTGTAISSLSGAALTSASLAAIGGGAVSAGGFGIIGGTIFITAAGSALGGYEGAVIGQNYFGAVKDFDISQHNSGRGERIILINGFLSQKTGGDLSNWRTGLEENFSQKSWYSVNWESKSLYAIGSLIGKGVAGKAFTVFINKIAKRASKKAASKINPLNWLSTIAEIFGNPWHSSIAKASMTGIMLADIISRTKGRSQYSLFAHSLGTRVVHYLLLSLSTKHKKYIKDVYLLGGTVDRNDNKTWKQASNSVSGNIYNCYSTNDDVLRFLFKPSTCFLKNPIGLGEIKSDADNILNINVSDIVSGHMQYKKKLPKILHLINE